jgi:hypothetical protein
MEVLQGRPRSFFAIAALEDRVGNYSYSVGYATCAFALVVCGVGRNWLPLVRRGHTSGTAQQTDSPIKSLPTRDLENLPLEVVHELWVFECVEYAHDLDVILCAEQLASAPPIGIVTGV